MDVMDIRVENAFHRLVENGGLLSKETGNPECSRMYRSLHSINATGLNRIDRIVLFQARWYETEEAILKRSSARLRCSNAVRWSCENGKINTLQELLE